MRVSWPSNGDFQLPGVDGEGYSEICSHFEAGGKGFPDVGLCLLTRFNLTHTAGNRGTFGNPNTVFIVLKGGKEPQLREAAFKAIFEKGWGSHKSRTKSEHHPAFVSEIRDGSARQHALLTQSVVRGGPQRMVQAKRLNSGSRRPREYG